MLGSWRYHIISLPWRLQSRPRYRWASNPDPGMLIRVYHTERWEVYYSGFCFSAGFQGSKVLWSTSAKNISVRAEWLRQSGRAPSEPSETPRWQITPRLASLPCVALHIAVRSQFRRFFLRLCKSILRCSWKHLQLWGAFRTLRDLTIRIVKFWSS